MKVKYAFTVAIVVLLVLLGGIAASHFLQSKTAIVALQRGHYKQAVEHLRKDAENGDIEALTMLANLHQLGLGVSRRFDMSVKLYSEAAFAGNVAARVNLGHAYSQGQGVTEDAALAYAWYNLARNSGSLVAQVYMSELLAEHRLTYHKVADLKMNYATINNFEKLHE